MDRASFIKNIVGGFAAIAIGSKLEPFAITDTSFSLRVPLGLFRLGDIIATPENQYCITQRIVIDAKGGKLLARPLRANGIDVWLEETNEVSKVNGIARVASSFIGESSSK